jgi:four helix bundle protein
MTVQNFKELTVWQRSFDLVRWIYEVTKTFPENEKFGLCSQMQRAAVSIPSNIAEGFGRQGTKEFIQFLYIAVGSCAELETQMLLSQALGYAYPPQERIDQITEIQKMLHGLIRTLKAR